MNKLEDYEVKFLKVAILAYSAAKNNLEKETGQSIYSFTVFCSSGCSSFGLAASSYEYLNEKSNESNENRNYFEVNAAEWEFVNFDYESFTLLNEFVDEIYEEFYDDGLDDGQINCFFERCIINLINELKTLHFGSQFYANELLFGLQFSDPTENGIKLMSQISEKVNSNSWNAKIQENLYNMNT